MAVKSLIATVTVGSGGAASIAFTAIPDTYTDLYVVYSLRTSTTTADPSGFYFNSDTAGNYSMRMLFADSNGVGSASNASYLSQYNNWAIFWMQGSNTTANTFGSTSVYIPNYALTTQYKSVSTDSVVENNDTALATRQIGAGLWRSNSAITAITLAAQSANFVEYSTASLYGIKYD
jgi:hypothetical protein